ncbi:MAG: hypothetical protein FWD15_02755 [Alphaproteobacteria bacterium]|nr:hypothetical protein [Alphaproteobacteria bacterium]
MKIFLFVMFFGFAAEAANPKRLEGWSYSRNVRNRGVSPKTQDFNDSFGQRDEPEFKHYLNDDGTDARFDHNAGGERYRTMPVYSHQELYDIRAGRAEPRGEEWYEDGEPWEEEAMQDSNYEEMSDGFEEFVE